MNPLAEISRRLDSLLLPGVIAAVDHAAARCRVRSGELLSAWLPWFSNRAGELREWSPPTIGEQCLVLSPGGDPACGFVLLGLFSQANPAPASAPALYLQTFADGASLSYDHEQHHFVCELPAGATVQLTAPGGVTIVGDITITGTVTVSDDVIAAGVSLVEHRHGGVQGGSSTTGVPQ